MSLYTVTFYSFGALAALAAIALIFSKNVFYGALILLVCLLSVAGIYVLAFAEFVAITQILIYAGGVLVVILFGIMLTTRLGQRPFFVTHNNLFSGILVGVAFLVMMVYYISKLQLPSTANGLATSPPSVENVGTALMTTYVLPFEVAGVLLLIALIGAAVIASHKTKELP